MPPFIHVFALEIAWMTVVRGLRSGECVATRGEASAGGETRGQRREGGGHFVQLAVHRNPKGLERTRGRILMPITPRARADGLRDDSCELACRGDRRDFACLRNCSCNRLSKPFLTIVPDDLRQLAHIGAGDIVGRALAALGIHAHVERAVGTVGKTAAGIVQLRR